MFNVLFYAMCMGSQVYLTVKYKHLMYINTVLKTNLCWSKSNKKNYASKMGAPYIIHPIVMFVTSSMHLVC